MQLKTVVLPAPLGPMMAVMACDCAVNETSSIATSPPKRMVRCSTSISGGCRHPPPPEPAGCSRIDGSRWEMRPRGLNTMISTMARPKASMR